MLCISVGGVFFELLEEFLQNRNRNSIHLVIIVSVFGKIAFNLKIHGDALLVANGLHLGKFDGGQGIRNHGQSRNPKRHKPLHIGIVERHLSCLIGVLIVHIMDGVHGVDIELCHLLHTLKISIFYLFVIQNLIVHGRSILKNLNLLFFVIAVIDCHQQRFGQIDPRAEELHPSSHLHGGYTAGNGIVVTVQLSHFVITLVLDGIGFNAHFCTVFFKFRRQVHAP